LGTGLAKKIAVLRVLIRKPKIVIIKDTSPFVGRWSIVELLKKYNPGCTIIKITNSLEVAYDSNRIILLEKLRIVEEGCPKKLQYDKLSKLGEMLRQCNEEA
jgi:energy-coupling factor transport system ATP-binding protein